MNLRQTMGHSLLAATLVIGVLSPKPVRAGETEDEDSGDSTGVPPPSGEQATSPVRPRRVYPGAAITFTVLGALGIGAWTTGAMLARRDTLNASTTVTLGARQGLSQRGKISNIMVATGASVGLSSTGLALMFWFLPLPTKRQLAVAPSVSSIGLTIGGRF